MFYHCIPINCNLHFSLRLMLVPEISLVFPSFYDIDALIRMECDAVSQNREGGRKAYCLLFYPLSYAFFFYSWHLFTTD